MEGEGGRGGEDKRNKAGKYEIKCDISHFTTVSHLKL